MACILIPFKLNPIDLGIENLPPITHLIFSFATESNPLAAGNYELTKSELYKNPILENSVGKIFTMKVKELIVGAIIYLLLAITIMNLVL